MEYKITSSSILGSVGKGSLSGPVTNSRFSSRSLSTSDSLEDSGAGADEAVLLSGSGAGSGADFG